MGGNTLKIWKTYIEGKYNEANRGYRYDEAAVLYECLDRLLEWIDLELDKDREVCYNKEPKKENVRENG